MYQLKSQNADFIVTENNSQRVSSLQKSGKFLYFWLSKNGWNTHSALGVLAKSLGIPSKAFSVAGLKDRHAITTQLCSLKVLGPAEKLEASLNTFSHPDITLSILGYANTPLSLGDLESNTFEIVVRKLLKNQSAQARDYFVNYFDEQRFSQQNATVGKLLLQKDFAKAAALLATSHNCVAESLQELSSDALRAIKTLSRRVLLLYLHAYQSFLFNELVLAYLCEKYSSLLQFQEYSLSKFAFLSDVSLAQEHLTAIPLCGFETDLEELDPLVERLTEDLLDQEGIDLDQFIIKQLEGMSLIGDSRSLGVKLTDLQISMLEDDELHQGFYKQTISFTIAKGSYATMLIRQLYDFE